MKVIKRRLKNRVDRCDRRCDRFRKKLNSMERNEKNLPGWNLESLKEDLSSHYQLQIPTKTR